MLFSISYIDNENDDYNDNNNKDNVEDDYW